VIQSNSQTAVKPIIWKKLQSGFKYATELNNVVKGVDELNLKFELQLVASQLHVSSGWSSRK